MIQTIKVIEFNEKYDLKGNKILSQIKIAKIKKVRSVRVYRLEGINKKSAKFLAEKLFYESITQNYYLNDQIFIGKVSKFEVAYKPGVMNPEAASIIKAAKDLGINLKAVDSSNEYIFFGKLTKAEFENLSLFNPLIEYIVEKPPKTLLISGRFGQTKTVEIINVNDDQLMNLSKDKLFLNLSEMKVIQRHYRKLKRNPTDCELETLAQTWSEHCAHKTFKAKLIVDGIKKKPLIERIKSEALKHNTNIVSAFVDNSGVMNFYDGFAICGKVETHNSPSAIEPYGGAMTGSGGVFRDVLGTGLGAKTIASTDIFCFANPDISENKLPDGCLPPDYLLKRVVAGVRDYGNRMGIPTVNGSVHFHDDFRAKPSVIVGAYGLIPISKAKKRSPKPQDIILVLGGRTGRDGIHGATFSSGEMTDKTISVNSSAVQIGNPIEEKRMFDAVLEAGNQNLIEAINDCGAGGFSSAIGEMGSKTGVKVDLSKAPLKYHGLSPWEIWISESQERMVIAVSKNNLTKILKICKKYNVEATVLGYFTNSKKLEIFFDRNKIADISMEFLHHGLPQRKMIGNQPVIDKVKILEPPLPRIEKEWVEIFKKILLHGNINSKEPIVRLYDHSVQGTNDLQSYSGIKMDGPNDAVVLRPFLNKKFGVVISHGLNPILNKIDPYWGSIWASVEALSNYVAVGGNINDASLINNYIWPFPDEESLWFLDKSVDAVIDVMRTLKIPVISGKDSLSSTYRKGDTIIKIPPVLCISVFGKILDVTKTLSSDFKKENSVIVLVGKQDLSMRGSTYFELTKSMDERIPRTDLKFFKNIALAIYKGINNRQILSCHDVSEGGLLTSVFEMCVGGDMGARLKIPVINNRADYFLFNETAGNFVVEVENEEIAKKLFANISYSVLGKTQNNKSIDVWNSKKLFSANLESLKRPWKTPMQKLFA